MSANCIQVVNVGFRPDNTLSHIDVVSFIQQNAGCGPRSPASNASDFDNANIAAEQYVPIPRLLLLIVHLGLG